MRRRLFLASLATTPLLAACGGGLRRAGPEMDPMAMGGTLIALHHTEGTGETLDAAGRARAAALAIALSGVEIDGIYAPDARRNIDTATPLATTKGLEVQLIPAVDIARTMFARQPGGTLVWVGNRDDLAALWAEIGAGGEPPVLYGDLFIVPMNGLSAGRVERGHFGA